jgi:hypothetical protein
MSILRLTVLSLAFTMALFSLVDGLAQTISNWTSPAGLGSVNTVSGEQ